MKTESPRIGVVLHRRTKKPAINRKTGLPGVNFVAKGEYAIMNREGYEVFLQHIYAIQKLRQINPLLIETLEKDLGFKLLDIVKQVK
jgi:hypothetical protein